MSNLDIFQSSRAFVLNKKIGGLLNLNPKFKVCFLFFPKKTLIQINKLQIWGFFRNEIYIIINHDFSDNIYVIIK